jgi:hypothetical protein
MGAGALKNMRSFVGRGAKVGTPVTFVCGAIADLASTIAKFSFYLLIVAVGTALLSGMLWFFRYRRRFLAAAHDGVMTPEEVIALGERNVWSVMFAFSVIATVVMGGFVIAEKVAGDGDKGVLATVVPGMDKVQEALFRVEKKIDAVKEDTAAIRKDTGTVRADTAKIAASVDEIAKRFDSLASTGGLIPGAKTPEQHYHNARVQELGGNFTAARKEYADYLAANLDVLDPWQSYTAMLKVQEGRAGAIETVRYFGDRLTPRTASYETALALLDDQRDSRLAKLQALAAKHADYGPLAFLLSEEFSDMKRGDQSIADKRAEKEWLEKFRAAHADGKFLKYFLDKKEAQKWLDSAEARRAKLAAMPEKALENPVSLSMMESSSGWSANLVFADYKVKEIFYKVDGKGDYQSTGHLPTQNPQTGLPMARVDIPLPNIAPGEHTIELKYTDKNDQTNGPYTLKFSTADAQMAQAKMMLNMTIGSWLAFRDYEGKRLLYFTGLMSYRPVLKEVRYSLNGEALDRIFAFKPSDKMYEVGDELYLTVPKDTQSAHVQVTYKDGTKSAVQKFLPKP